MRHASENAFSHSIFHKHAHSKRGVKRLLFVLYLHCDVTSKHKKFNNIYAMLVERLLSPDSVVMSVLT